MPYNDGKSPEQGQRTDLPPHVFPEILTYATCGFVAQLVGGSLGMAYGVCSTAFLLTTGMSLVGASAAVHASGLFNTGISGLSHLKFGNVDRALVLRLLPAGILGGVAGASMLTRVSGDAIKPFAATYLALMGIVVLVRAFRAKEDRAPASPRRLVPTGLVGGFMDAVGGGGWGVFVTSSLMAWGDPPRYVVGTVNVCKFFVNVAASTVFISVMGFPKTTAVAGLIAGGIFAGPLAAWACGRIPRRTMMVLAGILVLLVSGRTLFRSLG